MKRKRRMMMKRRIRKGAGTKRFSKYKFPHSNGYIGIIMKKEPMNSMAHNAGKCLTSVLAIAALVFLFLMAG
jgi:hypothetical protein